MIQYFKDLPIMSREEIIKKYNGYPNVAIVVYYDVRTLQGHLYAVGDIESTTQEKSRLLKEISNGSSPFNYVMSFPLFPDNYLEGRC